MSRGSYSSAIKQPFRALFWGIDVQPVSFSQGFGFLAPLGKDSPPAEKCLSRLLPSSAKARGRGRSQSRFRDALSRLRRVFLFCSPYPEQSGYGSHGSARRNPALQVLRLSGNSNRVSSRLKALALLPPRRPASKIDTDLKKVAFGKLKTSLLIGAGFPFSEAP